MVDSFGSKSSAGTLLESDSFGCFRIKSAPGYSSRYKPVKTTSWQQLEKEHKSTIRRLPNGCRRDLTDRLSCETQGVGGESCGRRCQRELEREQKRIITGRYRRRQMDITVFERGRMKLSWRNIFLISR